VYAKVANTLPSQLRRCAVLLYWAGAGAAALAGLVELRRLSPLRARAGVVRDGTEELMPGALAGLVELRRLSPLRARAGVVRDGTEELMPGALGASARSLPTFLVPDTAGVPAEDEPAGVVWAWLIATVLRHAARRRNSFITFALGSSY